MDLELVTNDRSGSNVFNQLKWIMLAGLATLVVMHDPKPLAAIANLSWPIIALCLLALMSTLWSVEPAITLRRAIRAALPVYSLIVGMAYVERPRRALAIIHFAFAALLLQNLVGLAIPGAYNFYGHYTGTATGKNLLGLWAAMGVLIGLGGAIWLTSPLLRRLNWAYLGGWLLLLVLSGSKTSMALTIAIPLLTLFLGAVSTGLRLGVGTIALAVICTILLVGGLTYSSLGMDLHDILNLFSEGITFTGRTQIWQFMLENIQSRWLLGYGFGGFWGTGPDAPNLSAKYYYIWLLSSAHNGYLDVLANLGFVGLISFFITLVHFSLSIDKIRFQESGIYHFLWMFILFILCHNAMESSIYHATENTLWYLFLLSVLLVARILVDRQTGASVNDGTPAFGSGGISSEPSPSWRSAG
ncbi:MAG: O-antigen ligase family protein [Boseongicola sp.]